jgi:hypothetical protein
MALMPRRMVDGQQSRLKELTGFQPNGRQAGMPLPAKPYLPAPYDQADIAALKALKDGSASPEQQRRGLAWIVECAARTNTQSYDEKVPSNRDFNEGCRHVGRQIILLLHARTNVNEEQGR